MLNYVHCIYSLQGKILLQSKTLAMSQEVGKKSWSRRHSTSGRLLIFWLSVQTSSWISLFDYQLLKWTLCIHLALLLAKCKYELNRWCNYISVVYWVFYGNIQCTQILGTNGCMHSWCVPVPFSHVGRGLGTRLIYSCIIEAIVFMGGNFVTAKSTTKFSNISTQWKIWWPL